MKSLSIIVLVVLVMLSVPLASCKKKNPVVEIQTPKGNIVVELYTDKAPVTAGHFLELAKKHVLDGGSFYRSVRNTADPNPVSIEVLQGGIQDRDPGPGVNPIAHETTKVTGVQHLDGVISMARTAPGSARTEFFICLGKQPELDFGGRRNPDGQGFAAFGKVIEGLEIARAIWSGPSIGQKIDPPVLIYKVVAR